MSTIYKTLGKNIKNYRKAKNLTSTEFANIISISTGHLSNIENGSYDVFRLDLLNRITKTLGISIGELLQPSSIDIRNLYVEERIKKVLIDEITEDSKEKIDHINQQLNAIIISFLATISAYDCDMDKVESISTHVIDELQFIKSLKDCDDKVPAS